MGEGLRVRDLVAAGKQQDHCRSTAARLRAERPPQPGPLRTGSRLVCHDRTVSEGQVYATRPRGHCYVSTDVRTARSTRVGARVRK